MKESKSAQSERMISRPLEIVLRIFGIWPGGKWNLFCKMFWLILITTIISCQYLFLITRVYSMKFNAFLHAMSMTLASTSKLIKFAIFWYNHRRFSYMWETMSVNWEHSSADIDTSMVTSKTHVSHFFPNFIVAFNSVSIVMTTYGTIANGIHYDENSNASRPYLLMMDLPFDDKKQSVYLLVISLQFLYMLLIVVGAATINAVLIILMQYIGNQVDIIRRNLTMTLPKEIDRETGVILIKDIIKRHQRIIAFSEDIESLYTYIAMALLILNTLITCCLGYLLVTALQIPNGTVTIAKNVMFYSIMNIETFVFCFAGEYISAKSREIGDAAYNSVWYQSKFHSHIILFLIMRSQNQLTITMGKFMDLSLERFTSVIKASASYVSVLLAMN